jgi:HK97 family phage prohead protease
MSQLFIRAYPTTLEIASPRQLTGRLVPYNVATDVLDEMPDGKMDIYKEGFRPGAFAPQANTREKGVLNKISLIHRHEGGLGFLGPFTGLRERPDGLWGDVAVLRSKASDVEDLLAAGVRELSVEFRLPRTGHTEVDRDGVRWRTRAHLDQVALEPRGAYRSAEVLAFRSELDEEQREQAEATATAEAERLAKEATEDAEAAALAEEHERAEREVELAAERRRRWDELSARAVIEAAKQDELVKQYGVTLPGGFRRQD